MITVIQDTREQTPYSFKDMQVEVRSISTGDYAIKGFERYFRIERKQDVDELIGNLTTGRDRFFRELDRLRAFKYRFLIVGCNWQDIADGAYRSRANKDAMRETVNSIIIDYEIPIIFACTDRQGNRIAENLIRRYDKMLTRFVDAINKTKEK